MTVPMSTTQRIGVLRQKKVAVLGAGASGLAAAHELLKRSHDVKVYEQLPHVGGVWKYTPAVESDPTGQREDRQRVHSSMYRSLRTNLPRELMGYLDFPFDTKFYRNACSEEVDDRRFPGHAEVQRYLEAYAETNGLLRIIEFGVRVQHCLRVASGGGASTSAPNWRVITTRAEGPVREEAFDAIVVANGHYSEPKIPAVRRHPAFPGLEVHSHNYRTEEAFAGKTVVVVGAMSSGEDLCREVSLVTGKNVYLSAKSWQNPSWGTQEAQRQAIGPRQNIYRRAFVSELHEDGTVSFEDGARTTEPVDIVLWCTGYLYKFPFLEEEMRRSNLISLQQEGYVEGLYKQLFAARDPTLSFIGLPWKVVPFPLCQVQSRVVAAYLAGAVQLPSTEEMLRETEAYQATRLAQGIPLRHSHMLGDNQWAYNAELSGMMGDAEGTAQFGPGSWRSRMYKATGLNKRGNPELYRDHWTDEALRAEAGAEFAAVRRVHMHVET